MNAPGRGRNPGELARPDLQAIFDLVEPGSRVLDLGCGSGELLQLLRERKQVSGEGVEISQENIMACVAKGLPVVHGDLDRGLADFEDQSFDTVILSQVLQVVRQPLRLLREMVRIGRQGIVSTMNFAHWEIRLKLLVTGRMPRTGTLPFRWYETPNIHLTTLADFEALCRMENLAIRRRIPVGGRIPAPLINAWPNFLAPMAVYRIGRGGAG